MNTSGDLTAADVERLSLPGKQVELVRGRLVVREPPGTRHGVIAANLTFHLSGFVRQRGLGIVCAQDTGFKIAMDPRRKHVLVYRQDGGISLLQGDASLDGEDVLPGFVCPLADVFA